MIDPVVKTLIFDLGGVILDVSVDNALQAFSELSKLDRKRVLEIYQQAPGFELYERGKITDGEFRDFIRSSYLVDATDRQIDDCWNAMLFSIPTERLQLLKKLMDTYCVILLSNTNNIHLNHINKVIMPSITGEHSLTAYFHKTYYSHLMLKRKPDAEIFDHILKENKLVPEETLFLDDNELNIEGAKSLGIKTAHVTSANFIIEYFNATGKS